MSHYTFMLMVSLLNVLIKSLMRSLIVSYMLTASR